jgi:quinol monooxygenase YgiN
MTVTVALECHARPDTVEDVKQLFRSLATDTRAFEGCESINIFQDPDEPTTIVALNRWTSRDHYLRYVAWRQERGELDEIAALLVDRTRRFFEDTSL